MGYTHAVDWIAEGDVTNPAMDMRTRQVSFAMVKTPYRPPTRKDGVAFLEGLSARGLPDLSYRYSPNPQKDGREMPSIHFVHQDGRARLEVAVDCFNGAQRLLINSLFPPSREVAVQQADEVFDLFQGTLGSGLDAQMAEARVACDVPSPRATALANLGSRFFGHESLKLLKGEIDFVQVLLKTAPEEREPTHPLDNPTREVKVEKLLEDPRRIYVEVMAQWPRVHQLVKDDTMHVSQGPVGAFDVRKPTEYLGEIASYIGESVVPFIQAKRE